MTTPQTPPALEPGFRHLNGGTRREPKPGEWYVNENSIKRGKAYTNYTHPDYPQPMLDPEIPYNERWIVEPI